MAVDWDRLVLGPTQRVFGEPVTYAPADDGPFQTTGIFDRAYTEVDIAEDGTQINTTLPVLGVRLSQFPIGPKQGDQLTVQGGVYVVKDVRPDGHGAAKLMLNRLRSADE